MPSRRFATSTVHISNRTSAEQACHKPFADPAAHSPLRIFALLLCSVSCLRNGYSTEQKFDFGLRPALRMTRGAGAYGMRPYRGAVDLRAHMECAPTAICKRLRMRGRAEPIHELPHFSDFTFCPLRFAFHLPLLPLAVILPETDCIFHGDFLQLYQMKLAGIS